MVPEHSKFVKPVRPEMKPPTQWVWNGLGFIMVIEAGQVPPARVAADFDEAGADHDPEDKPAKKPNDDRGRRAFWKGPGIEHGAEKYGQEPGLKQLNFPAVSIPVLTDMDEGHVERPENRHQGRVGKAEQYNGRESNAKPGSASQERIGVLKPENAGQLHECGSSRT